MRLRRLLLDAQLAPPALRLLAEGGGVGAHSTAQLLLLRIEAPFDETASSSVKNEARTGSAGGERGAEEDGQGLALPGELQVKGVIDNGGIALNADAGGNGLRRSEEGDGLIDEMRSKIEQETAAGAAAFAPHLAPRLGAEAVEVGFHGHEPPQLAARDHLADGLEVAIPAAVLVGGEEKAALARHADQGRQPHWT